MAKTQSTKPAAPEGPGVLELLEGVRQKTLAPKSLSPGQRRDCVLYMHTDGISVPEIARLLGVSDRTIGRDLAQIREDNALARDPKLAEKMAGRLMQVADLSIGRIRRVTRDPDMQPAAKVATSGSLL